MGWWRRRDRYRHQAPTYLVGDEDDGQLVFWLSLPTSGDGAIITTMSDLVRWLRQLRAEDGTPASILERLTAPFELNDGTPALYRRGIYEVRHRQRGLRGWGHGGATGTHYVVWPALDLIVANFTNALIKIRASSMSLAVTDCVGDWPEPRRFVRVTPPEPAEIFAADYTGTYRSAALGVHYTVEDDDGGLLLRIGAGIEAGQILTLEAITRDVFLARFREREALEGLILPGLVSIRFFRDPEGRVSTMHLSIDKIRDLAFDRVCECGQPR